MLDKAVPFLGVRCGSPGPGVSAVQGAVRFRGLRRREHRGGSGRAFRPAVSLTRGLVGGGSVRCGADRGCAGRLEYRSIVGSGGGANMEIVSVS
ncbi:hypothetical protein GCM10010431_66670 [Streptomyces kunmingensis]